jgi:hypothetical protein
LGRPVKDSNLSSPGMKDLLRNPFHYPWKSLLSTSALYEPEIKTSRSNLHLSFELWKQLAEITTETLGISAEATPPAPTPSELFVKAIIPSPAQPKKAPPQNVMSSRARTEKGLIEALIEARKNGNSSSFQRRPGVYSSILKGPQSGSGEKPSK